jgi:transcriptional regulator with XRE-family HTH domain
MQTWTLHERLRQARMSRGDGLETLAQRIGVRASVLRSIEAGRYDELPPGIYGRAAIRAFAEALGFDGQAVIRECDDRLPPVEDPIAGLARIRGIRTARDMFPVHVPDFRLKAEATRFLQRATNLVQTAWSLVQRAPRLAQSAVPRRAFPTLTSWRRALPTQTAWRPSSGGSSGQRSVRQPNWRILAAAAIDAAIVISLLLALVGATVAAFRIRVSALGPGAAPAFGIVGMLLGITYFAVFGGIGGQTLGARVAGLGAQSQDCSPVNLAAVATRAFRSAARDALAIEQLAAWVVCLSATNRS